MAEGTVKLRRDESGKLWALFDGHQEEVMVYPDLDAAWRKAWELLVRVNRPWLGLSLVAVKAGGEAEPMYLASYATRRPDSDEPDPLLGAYASEPAMALLELVAKAEAEPLWATGPIQ